MNIDALRSFLLVVETGKISAAAEMRHMVPPGVSRQIKQLESELGGQLVLHLGNKIQITPFGRSAYDLAKKVVQHMDELLELQARLESRLSVGASLTAVPSFLPSVVALFRERYTSTDITIQVGLNSQILDLMLQGQIDVGIVSAPVEHKLVESQALFDDPLMLVCDPEHPFVNQDSIEIRDLNSVPMISFPRGVKFRDSVDEILHHHDVTPRIRMEVDSFEVIKRMVESRLGTAILPRSSCLREFRDSTLVGVRMHHQDKDGPSHIVGERVMSLIRLSISEKPIVRQWSALCREVAENDFLE